MFLKRRQFIVKTSGLIALTQLGPYTNAITKFVENKKNNFLLICDTPTPEYGKSSDFVVTSPGSIQIYDTKNNTTKKIAIDFFGHTLTCNPNTTNIVASFEQYGSRGVLADIKEANILKKIKAKKENTFMGHCAFIPEKKWLVTTEHNHLKKQGEIVMRDQTTLEEIKTLTIKGKKPHDCRYIAKSKTIMVTNGAKPSSFEIIDIETGVLVKKINLIDQEKSGHSHFDISEDGWIVAAPRNGNAAVNLISPDFKTYSLEHPKTAEPGILSLSFLPRTEFIIATYPEANLVQIWNYKTKKIFDTLNLPSPKGVIYEINLNKNKSTALVSLEAEQKLKRIIFGEKHATIDKQDISFGGSGSHLAQTIID